MAKYNLKEDDTPKQAAYRTLLRAELADELYDKIQQKLIVEKKYLDANYSAAMLARDLHTNNRYISAVINLRFQMNYSQLVNEYRIKDAMFMLQDKRYNHYTMEQIAIKVGFANRQSFYSAFFKRAGLTPREFKILHKNK